jgi:high-affinity iron transporter
VWAGILASVAASFGLGYLLQRVNQPLWEGVLAFVAAALVATFVIHMWRVAPRMKKQMEAQLEQHTTSGSRLLAIAGTFAFTLFMVTREGMETALMLIQVRQGRFWLGCALGLASAAAMSALWAHFGHRININRFFQVTGLFLLLFVAQIVFNGIHELAEAELLPNSDTIHAATEPYGPDGRYAPWITLGMLTICAAWLAGATALDRSRAERVPVS